MFAVVFDLYIWGLNVVGIYLLFFKNVTFAQLLRKGIYGGFMILGLGNIVSMMILIWYWNLAPVESSKFWIITAIINVFINLAAQIGFFVLILGYLSSFAPVGKVVYVKKPRVAHYDDDEALISVSAYEAPNLIN